jgi:GTP-binding protein
MHKKMHGAKGNDLVVKVPVGTLLHLKALDGRAMDLSIIDFDKEGMRVLVAKGGKGGKGNVHFKSSRNTTPMTADKGFEERCLM